MALLAVAHARAARRRARRPRAARTVDERAAAHRHVDGAQHARKGRLAIHLATAARCRRGAAVAHRQPQAHRRRCARAPARAATSSATAGCTARARASRRPPRTSVYARLELPYIPPELREDGSELDTAERNGLPQLVALPHIRGDLHAHTIVERRARHHRAHGAGGARARLRVLRDHRSLGARVGVAHAARSTDVPKQRAEIEAVRAQRAGHRRAARRRGGHPARRHARLSRRRARRLRHRPGLAARRRRPRRRPPHRALPDAPCGTRSSTSSRTPPTGRPAPAAGYDLDFDRLFEVAVETGTAMEVDGAPGHLDMDGAVARRAAEQGVTIVIDSDCHRADSAGPADGVRGRDGPSRLGRAAPRPQHAERRRGPRLRGRASAAAAEPAPLALDGG